MISFTQRFNSNNLFNDSFWAILGSFIPKGMIFIGTLFIARTLGNEIYGEYGAIYNFVFNTAIFTTIGLVSTSTKFVSEMQQSNPSDINQVVRKILILTSKVSVVFSLLVFSFSEDISLHLLASTDLGFSLRIISFWIFFNALTNVQIGILSGARAYKEMAKVNVFIGLFGFLTMVLFSYFFGLNGALTSLLITQIINCLFNFKIILKYFPEVNKKIIFDESLKNKLIQFTIPIAFQDSLYAITAWITTIIFVNLSDYGEVGLYSAAMQWSAIILYIPGVLRNVVLSHLSENSKNQSGFNKVLKSTLFLNIVVNLLLLVFCFMFMPFLSKLYGQSYTGLEKVLSISLFSTIFITCSSVFTQAFVSKGKSWLIFRIHAFKSTLLISSIYFLLYNNIMSGAIAVAGSFLIANILFFMLMLFFYFFNHNFIKSN